MRTIVILGAGFSKNSGLPVQIEIPALLIKESGKDNFESAVSGVLRRFMEELFCYGEKYIPNWMICLPASIYL